MKTEEQARKTLEKIWVESDDELEPCKAYWHYNYHGYKTRRLANLTSVQKSRLAWNLGCVRTVMRKINGRCVFVKIISPEVFDNIMVVEGVK